MSSIPPSITAASLQTVQAQTQTAGIQKAEKNSRDQAFRDEIRMVEERGGTVFASDEDTRVNPDGGGTGSQGRAFGSRRDDGTPAEDEDTPAVTLDETGRPHLDLEA